MKNLVILLFILFAGSIYGQNEKGHRITFDISNYENDTLLIGYYYGNRQLVHDTLYRNNDQFILEGSEVLNPSMYLAILKPDNNFLQFLVPGNDQEFSISTDAQNLESFTTNGSQDNQLFTEYMSFIKSLNQKATKINSEKGKSLTEEEAKNKLESLTLEVYKYQDEIIQNDPKSLIAKLIKVNRDVEIPTFTGTKEEINLKRYHYFRNHYFDYLDLSDDEYSRLPFTFQKIEKYIDNYTPQHPDSINQSLDEIFNKMQEGGSFFKFYLSHFLNKYAKSNIVGMDAVYVHLVDNYYAKGKADWVDEKSVNKMIDNVRFLRPTLIGKKAQDVSTFRKDSSKVNLYSIDSEYTVLYIYAYDCGHCKKSTPHLVEFQKKYKDRGVTIFTICSKQETEKCWEFTEEKEMDGFINTVDPYNTSRFRTKFDVRQTPKIYILNRDKEIVMKGFNVENIEKIMNEIIKIENTKS